MKRLGFIRDMMDVKVLILFVLTRANYPMTTQEIYELCFQDECLSYFDVCTAIPEMVKTGHLNEVDGSRFEITERGRQDSTLTEEDIAFSIRQRAEDAVTRYNRQLRRRSFIKTQVIPRNTEDCSVMLSLDDEKGNLMTLELMAPDQRQAIRLSRLFEAKAEKVYNLIMAELLTEENDL